MKNLILLTALFFFCTTLAFSQQTEETADKISNDKIVKENQKDTSPSESNTALVPARSTEEFIWPEENLTTQYNYLMERSETYNDYKVIKNIRIDTFWKMVKDSVQILKNNLAGSELVISDQQAEIAGLKQTISANEASMANTEFTMTHIRFLGIDFSKSAYITINVAIVAGLILLLGFGFILFNFNRQTTKQKVADYAKLEVDFAEFRSNSLEKQIKLSRELQTERNALEQIMNKSTITKKMPA